VVSAGLPRLGPRTITDAQLLSRALDQVRTQGYAVSVEESALGFASVGAPIFAPDKQCIAAVSVAGPVSRLRPEAQDRLVRLVVTAGHDITMRLSSGSSA
jgi:DNA-binding IclR family transcriptional regulator